jgi:hypothetical protein
VKWSKAERAERARRAAASREWTAQQMREYDKRERVRKCKQREAERAFNQREANARQARKASLAEAQAELQTCPQQFKASLELRIRVLTALVR